MKGKKSKATITNLNLTILFQTVLVLKTQATLEISSIPFTLSPCHRLPKFLVSCVKYCPMEWPLEVEKEGQRQS